MAKLWRDITGQTAMDKAVSNQPKPINLSTGGISIKHKGGAVNVSRSPELQGILRNLSSTSSGVADELGALKSQLRPGYGALTEAATSQLENRRRRAIGNLRENLGRRRVLGSSFGQDAITRAEAEFAKTDAEIRAQSMLQEIDAMNKIILQEGAAKLDSFNVLLNQSNLESTMGANFISGAQNQLNANYQTLTQLAASNAQGLGNLVGTAAGIGAGFLSGGIGSGIAGGVVGGGASNAGGGFSNIGALNI